ncbi:SDR family NAD(P)-dependent oxidoreductase [Streptomyces prunicolor]|uniref:SDR family NAD(P)-dependent oxidoreductase n=1 Tax=Streptomyces prunicolor TaxID=67348 RepID=UPI00371920E6
MILTINLGVLLSRDQTTTPPSAVPTFGHRLEQAHHMRRSRPLNRSDGISSTAVAIRLGRLGANVVVNYARDSSGAAATVVAIEDASPQAVTVQADVSQPDEIEALLDTARSRFGGLDIVVANAGLDEGLGPVLDVTEAACDRMFNVNAKGAFFRLQTAGGMVDSGGSVIRIGSGSALRPTAGFGLCTSSKLPGSARPGNRRTRGHGRRSHPDRDRRSRPLLAADAVCGGGQHQARARAVARAEVVEAGRREGFEGGPGSRGGGRAEGTQGRAAARAAGWWRQVTARVCVTFGMRGSAHG